MPVSIVSYLPALFYRIANVGHCGSGGERPACENQASRIRSEKTDGTITCAPKRRGERPRIPRRLDQFKIALTTAFAYGAEIRTTRRSAIDDQCHTRRGRLCRKDAESICKHSIVIRPRQRLGPTRVSTMPKASRLRDGSVQRHCR
jgi:hypothetical protein